MNFSLYMDGELTNQRRLRLMDEAAAVRRADEASGRRPERSARFADVVGQVEERVALGRRERQWTGGRVTAPLLQPEIA